MGYVWFFVILWAIALIIESPWILVVIVVVIGVIFFYNAVLKDLGDSDDEDSDSKIDTNCVHEAVRFLSSYLLLCKKHSVIGLCYITIGESDDAGCKVDGDCIIFSIDGEHAEDYFSYILLERDRALCELKKSYEAYQTAIDQVENRIKCYFGSDALHYVFIDPDEYHFNDSDITFHYEGKLFTFGGFQRGPTLNAIVDEISSKFPDAEIKRGKYGVGVK